MNYIELHLGDYAEATAHLSFVEDAAYMRLIRKIYATEAPLPADIKAVQRLVGARSKEERDAVETVLQEFFALGADGWRQARCDAEIARYRDKQDKARRSANARWKHHEPHSEGSASAMRTHSEGNALQTPDTRHQTPEEEIQPPASPVPPAVAGKVSKREAAKVLTRQDLVDDGVDPRVADDWLLIRKAKKAPLTQTAWDGVKREAAAAGLPPAYAVKVAVERNWQGFKADWLRAAGRAVGAADGSMSFRERDQAADRRRWEEMTGRKWPEDGRPAPDDGNTFDVQPMQTTLVEG